MAKPQIDLGALYTALDSKRDAQRKSWRDVAGELEISPSVLTRLAQGRRPDLDTFLAMVRWLGTDADSFIRGDRPPAQEEQETVAVISTYLRADRALKPESAQAIENIVRTAYEQLADREP
jgi:transcriptional regulator with XRE-family HTH domain